MPESVIALLFSKVFFIKFSAQIHLLEPAPEDLFPSN